MMKKQAAVVTGGCRGIGLGISLALAKDGWPVLAVGRKAAAEVSAALAQIQQAHPAGAGAYLAADISAAAAGETILAAAKENFDGVGLLVNNAGVAPTARADLLELNRESYRRLMAINLEGPLFLTQTLAREFAAQNSGMIVNITSISASVASVNRGEYCISKAGLSMLSALFAARLGEFNVPVYEVRPGVIATDMTAGVKEKYEKMLADGLAVQSRFGLPEDVGKTVAALARGDLPYSTGAVIPVDGGLTLARL